MSKKLTKTQIKKIVDRNRIDYLSKALIIGVLEKVLMFPKLTVASFSRSAKDMSEYNKFIAPTVRKAAAFLRRNGFKVEIVIKTDQFNRYFAELSTSLK